MARKWTSGWEMNSATSGRDFTTSGSPTISSTTVRSGSYAGRVNNATSGTGKYFQMYWTNSDVNGPIYARFYLRIATSVNANTRLFNFQSATSPYTQTVYLNLNTDDTISLYDEDGQIGSASTALSKNTWYRIEVKMDRSGSAGSHAVELRIDGSSVASASDRNLSLGTCECAIGVNLNGDSCTTCDLFFDDFALNDSSGSYQNSWPGEGKVVLALPVGAGDNAANVGTYADIDEIPPGTTDYIQLTGTTSIGDYAMTDSSTLGIGSSDTVSLVQPVAFVRESVAGTSNYGLRVKSASAGTLLESSLVDAGNATPRINPSGTAAYRLLLVSYTDPSTGSAWTPTGTNSIDNMQIGVKTTDGDPDIWVHWLGAYIEYVVSSAYIPRDGIFDFR